MDGMLDVEGLQKQIWCCPTMKNKTVIIGVVEMMEIAARKMFEVCRDLRELVDVGAVSGLVEDNVMYQRN